MKKPNLKSILKRFTWVDMIIILCIVGAVVFAFIQIGSNDDNGESISFDSSTTNKLVEKYLSFYREGKIVKSHVGGYNSTSGEYQELYGTVVWVDDDKGSNVKVLLDINGQLVLAGHYEDIKEADIYIEHITLETNGEKYKNVTDIVIEPKNISSLDELTKDLPKNLNYTITGTVAIEAKDSQTYKSLANELYFNGKRISVKMSAGNLRDEISLVMAQDKEVAIFNRIFGVINGKTGLISIRIYNSTDKDIKSIEKIYSIKSIRTVS